MQSTHSTQERSPLANTQFRWLIASNVGFFLALYGETVARSWLAFELTGSKVALGMIAAAAALPMVLGAPLGGVIADRMERRNLILFGQLAAFGGEVAILLLLWSDRLELWHLVGCTVLIGLAFPMVIPARQAIVANLVSRDALTGAIAISMGALHACRVVGPLVFGVLIGASGVRAAYGVAAGLYVVAILCVLQISRSRAAAAVNRRSVLDDMREGVRYVASNRLVSVLLLFGLVPMILAMPVQQLLVVFAEEAFHTGSWGFGVLQGATGAGGVLAAVFMARRNHASRVHLMLATAVASPALLLLFAFVPWFWPAVGLVVGAYACGAVFTMLNNAAILLLVPDRVRGRVSSFVLVATALPLMATLPVGALADAYGANAAVASTSIACLIAVAVLRLTSASLHTLDERLDLARGDAAQPADRDRRATAASG
jgi:MFS family permease